jgi:hypothetical protein
MRKFMDTFHHRYRNTSDDHEADVSRSHKCVHPKHYKECAAALLGA